jgi:hypothetical protein
MGELPFCSFASVSRKARTVSDFRHWQSQWHPETIKRRKLGTRSIPERSEKNGSTAAERPSPVRRDRVTEGGSRYLNICTLKVG